MNLAVPRANPAKSVGVTGIDKQPVAGPVRVRAPGPKRTGLGSGLVGDQIFDVAAHGGDDQAVYAYAREDLDAWAGRLGRELPNGAFGENLTTRGVDVTGALIGERWRIGERVVLEVAVPRIPCGTFAHWMADQGWIKRFTAAAVPGAYLRVIVPGEISAGGPIVVEDRPDHDVTIGMTFRALTLGPELLPRLLAADGLPREAPGTSSPPHRHRALERSDGARQQAELVSFGIGEYDPARVGRLPHVDVARTEGEQPLQLLRCGHSVGAQVEVQPVLGHFALRYGRHVDHRPGPVRGRDGDQTVLLIHDLPVENRAPELGDQSRSDGVDDDNGKTARHAAIIARRDARPGNTGPPTPCRRRGCPSGVRRTGSPRSRCR